MSELSQAEISAGISRSAIQSLTRERNNGHRRRDRVDASSVPASDPCAAIKEPVPELTHVLLSHQKQLDIINVNGWQFQIRNTIFLLSNSQSSYLHLTRPELEKLESTIHRVLAEAGPPRAEE